jgi:hypothetical protein
VAATPARSLKESAQLWWILNREHAGLFIPVLVLAAAFVLFRPVGHPTMLIGVVTAINAQDVRRHPPFNAWVDLGGSQTTIELPAQHGCVVGSRIKLQKVRFSFARRYFGEHYTTAGHGCEVPPETGVTRLDH